MAVPCTIIDSRNRESARVTAQGQLVVAPLSYSRPVEHELLTVNTAVNFIEPAQDLGIVITDIMVSSDKDVSANTPADVVIYQADSEDTTVPSPTIIRPQLLRAQNFSMTGLNLFIDAGKWVNAKTTDAGIILTIMFYRVPTEGM